MMQKHRVALGLGSNLGDRESVLRRAVGQLAEEFLENAVSSSIYETPPWGIAEQPDFLNLVVVGDTEWKPPAIVNYVKGLERELGRIPAERYGPRIVDIDLLAWGEERWHSDGVTVPHPRMRDREFVLFPMQEVWPEWRDPVSGKTVMELCRDLSERQPLTAAVFAPAVRLGASV